VAQVGIEDLAAELNGGYFVKNQLQEQKEEGTRVPLPHPPLAGGNLARNTNLVELQKFQMKKSFSST
jgi:hypothetical protein